MSGENIVSLGPKLEARKLANLDLQTRVDRSADHFRILCRAVREIRERGAMTSEIVHALRAIASELEGGSQTPA